MNICEKCLDKLTIKTFGFKLSNVKSIAVFVKTKAIVLCLVSHIVIIKTCGQWIFVCRLVLNTIEGVEVLLDHLLLG